MDMSGKAVLVTGAASGIGRATAIRYAQQGALRVACLDIHEAGNRQTAELVEKAGAQALRVKVDLGQVADIRKAYSLVMTEFGSLDASAHAGGYTWSSDALCVSEDDWDSVINVNLRGTFFCCQEAMKIMCPRRRGAIVNISANPAFFPVAGFSVQAAAKGAVALMSKTLALEAAGHGVRVNTVSPARVAVEHTGLAPDSAARRSRDVANTPLGRPLNPTEVADAIVFLSSSSASGITGQLLFVDGGGYGSPAVQDPDLSPPTS